MKFKYLLINEDGSVKGTNKISALNVEDFECGVLSIIDTIHGENMINSNPEEWEDIEEDKSVDF